MKRVLIVNDEEMTRKIISLALRRVPDTEVIGEAKHGWDAIDFVEMNRPDVVVMDFHMPFMDGLEATEQITSNWPNVKVIIYSMTGVSQQAGKSAGACKVLGPWESITVLQTAVLNA